MRTYQIELANKFRKGCDHAIGNLYVVTRRPIGLSAIIATFETRDQAAAWIARVEACPACGKTVCAYHDAAHASRYREDH